MAARGSGCAFAVCRIQQGLDDVRDVLGEPQDSSLTEWSRVVNVGEKLFQRYVGIGFGVGRFEVIAEIFDVEGHGECPIETDKPDFSPPARRWFDSRFSVAFGGAGHKGRRGFRPQLETICKGMNRASWGVTVSCF